MTSHLYYEQTEARKAYRREWMRKRREKNPEAWKASEKRRKERAAKGYRKRKAAMKADPVFRAAVLLYNRLKAKEPKARARNTEYLREWRKTEKGKAASKRASASRAARRRVAREAELAAMSDTELAARKALLGANVSEGMRKVHAARTPEQVEALRQRISEGQRKSWERRRKSKGGAA